MQDLIRANFGLLAAGVATFVMMGAGQSLYGPALPAFARDLMLTPAGAGWLVSAHWVGCAIGVALMYWHGARVSPRHVLATMAIGAAMLGLGPGQFFAFGGALVFGAGYGMSTVVFNPRILRVFGAHGTAMLSLLNACFGIGAIAAPLVFVWLGSDPGLTFLLVAVMATTIWLGAGPAGRAGAAPVAEAAGPFRPMLALQMFAVVGIGVEASLIGLGPTALIATGMDEAAAAQHLSAFFVAFLGVRVALVVMAHLIQPFGLYLGAMALSGLCCGLAALISPGLFFVLTGAGAGLFFPSFYVAASRVMGDDPRTPSVIIAGGLVGGILTPILLGNLMEHIGGTGFFWLLAAATTGAAIAAGVVRQRLPTLRG
jgi:hypothetical protein